jgi:DNA-binding winged helix-turn-helix (wHTH) protein/pimeloyl-ACP methyl ester carboxylesterase
MRYRFANCEIDTERHEFSVDGGLTPLEPQVFDLLALLVQHPGRLVSRDELVGRVWGGRIVSESTILARINAARRAVRDNGERQAIIATVPRRGIKLVAAVETVAEASDAPRPVRHASAPDRREQRLQFCHSLDGTRIAFATFGTGYPLVRAGHWLTHLDHDWHSPVWQPFLDELGKDFGVTRYDQRGNGLSDWDPPSFTLSAFIEDLEAVVDRAGLDRFALYGVSQGAPIAAAYTARHPDRVSKLILHGGYVQGRLIRGDEHEREKGRALLTLVRHGWGNAEGPLIQAFASMFIPGGTREQVMALTELQRISTSPENAARLRAAFDQFDVGPILDQIRVPTLVMHARNDGVQPLDQGRRLAAGIRNAEFALLESGNHVILSHEPAFAVLLRDMRRFVFETTG